MENKMTFEKLYSRLALEGIIKAVMYSVVFGFLLSFTVSAVASLSAVNLVWLAVVIFFAATYAAIPLLYFKKFRPTAKTVAKRLDRLGLDERILTMMEFKDDDSAMAKVQRRDAEAQLSRIKPEQLKIKIFKLPVILIAVSALLAVGMNVFSVINVNLSHDWGEWTILKPASCAADGAEIRACKKDGAHTEMRYTPLLSDAHDFNDWVVTTPAGESTNGEETMFCKNNPSHTVTRVLSALGSRGLAFTLIKDVDSYSVSAGTATAADIFIPAFHNGKPVTRISSTAFRDRNNLKTVRFAEDSLLTAIGYEAFYNCVNLESIFIPKSVNFIGDSAFFGCALKSIEIPADIVTIYAYTFKNCENLESVTFAEDSLLENIGKHAFYNCSSLIEINIPDNIFKGDGAFYNCPFLES